MKNYYNIFLMIACALATIPAVAMRESNLKKRIETNKKEMLTHKFEKAKKAQKEQSESEAIINEAFYCAYKDMKWISIAAVVAFFAAYGAHRFIEKIAK